MSNISNINANGQWMPYSDNMIGSGLGGNNSCGFPSMGKGNFSGKGNFPGSVKGCKGNLPVNFKGGVKPGFP